MTREEVLELCPLFSLERPKAFGTPVPIKDQELFEESALGILSARQSTNFSGHKQVSLGFDDSKKAQDILQKLEGVESPPLDHASYTHIVLCRPYRTPFTMLLTLVGHLPVLSLLTVPIRAIRKKLQHIDDIPTIGYLTHLHVGILADCLDRAVVLASEGKRRANILMAPFSGLKNRKANRGALRQLEKLAGLTRGEKNKGWRIAFVAQVGQGVESDAFPLSAEVCRKAAANILAFRSERVQPGVNHEEKAPDQYHHRQSMDVPEELTLMAGRAAYNAFAHWACADRESGKAYLLLDRVDVLTDNGKERLREIRDELGHVTDRVAAGIPLWADLPFGRVFSKNTRKSRKAFALTGQRIYIAGLSKKEMKDASIPWELALRAVGAAASRSSLLIELCGVIDLPEGCDLLAGFCVMAGPVNQNDIGKTYYGGRDLLAGTFPDRDPCSLLIWTVKAKTLADPIGNEEQLMNPARKGALVDLRPGPHDVIQIRRKEGLAPFRQEKDLVSTERAYADLENFVVSPSGKKIPGNEGKAWPKDRADKEVW